MKETKYVFRVHLKPSGTYYLQNVSDKAEEDTILQLYRYFKFYV